MHIPGIVITTIIIIVIRVSSPLFSQIKNTNLEGKEFDQRECRRYIYFLFFLPDLIYIK